MLTGKTALITGSSSGIRLATAIRLHAGLMKKPEDFAAAVAFLAGDDATYLLGVEINVDGKMAEI